MKMELNRRLDFGFIGIIACDLRGYGASIMCTVHIRGVGAVGVGHGPHGKAYEVMVVA